MSDAIRDIKFHSAHTEQVEVSFLPYWSGLKNYNFTNAPTSRWDFKIQFQLSFQDKNLLIVPYSFYSIRKSLYYIICCNF